VWRYACLLKQQAVLGRDSRAARRRMRKCMGRFSPHLELIPPPLEVEILVYKNVTLSPRGEIFVSEVRPLAVRNSAEQRFAP